VDRSVGLLLLGAAAVLALVGLVALTGALAWFGRLPGDVRITGRNTTIYAPIVSMLLVSLVLSVIIGLVSRLR